MDYYRVRPCRKVCDVWQQKGVSSLGCMARLFPKSCHSDDLGKENYREYRGGVGSRPHPFLGMMIAEFKVPLGQLLNCSPDKEVEIWDKYPLVRPHQG